MAHDSKIPETRPLLLAEDITDRRAWKGNDLSPKDWLVPLPTRCLIELDAAAARLRHEPLPTVLLEPSQFTLAACAEAMDRVREKLCEGVGLAVLDRVPVERYSASENQAIAWLLTSLLGRPVAQKWDGAMLYDVRDTGKSLEYGVRRSVTNLDITFHTDAAWLEFPPEFVGLYCINPALGGGASRFVSLCSAHNEFRQRRADLLPRLYRPFPWDRQGEHWPNDNTTTKRPIFQSDSRSLLARFNPHLIATGADLAGEPLDDEGREALTVLQRIVDSPEFSVQFVIDRGQVQFINNRQFAHSRTDFTDAEDPKLKRHLIRLWVREEGHRSFHAQSRSISLCDDGGCKVQFSIH